MKKKHFLKMMILLILCMNIIPMNLTEMNTAALSKRDFVPKSQNEKIIGHTAMGSWNNGNFFGTVIYELVGFDDEAITMKYRFRYYIIHKGSAGFYIYQKIPVGVFLDNKKVTTFFSRIGKHIANKTQLCGEEIVTIKSGTHVTEPRDIKDGALTVVNMTKSINIPLPPYSVKFLDDDGTVLKTQTVERYKSASAPEVSNKTGRTFTGWDKPFQNVHEDLVITAQHIANTYAVNFLDWDGRILKTQTISHGGNAPPPSSPTREGCVFQGWKGDYTNVTGSKAITISYKIRTFTVTFDSSGGSFVTSQTIAYGDKADTPADPVKKDNKFMGWYTATDVRYDFRQPVKSSVTLYAHWGGEPVITTQNTHIFEDLCTVRERQRIRLERAKTQDREDGDISTQLAVLKDTTNLKKQGTYELTYEVKDSAGNRSEKNIKVIVLDKHAQGGRSGKYTRSISASHIQTLHPDDYWRTTAQFQRLTQSLQKASAQTGCAWHLTAEDIAKVRSFNTTHGYSTQENKAFLGELSYLRG